MCVVELKLLLRSMPHLAGGVLQAPCRLSAAGLPYSAANCPCILSCAQHSLMLLRASSELSRSKWTRLLCPAEMLPVGHKRKRVQTKLFGDDFVRDDLRPGKGARRRKVMEPGGPDEAQGADALLSLAALAEADSGDTQSADEGGNLLKG